MRSKHVWLFTIRCMKHEENWVRSMVNYQTICVWFYNQTHRELHFHASISVFLRVQLVLLMMDIHMWDDMLSSAWSLELLYWMKAQSYYLLHSIFFPYVTIKYISPSSNKFLYHPTTDPIILVIIIWHIIKCLKIWRKLLAYAISKPEPVLYCLPHS